MSRIPDCFKHPSGVVRPWDLPTDHGTRWVGDKERAVLVMGCGAERGDGRGDQHLPATSAAWAWASAASPPASQTDRQTDRQAYSGVRSLLYLLTRTLTEDSFVVLVPLNSPQHPSTGSAVESEILGWSFPLAFKYDLLATCLINYLVTEKTVSDKNEI